MNRYFDALPVPELPTLSPWSEVDDTWGGDVGQWSQIDDRTFDEETAMAGAFSNSTAKLEPPRRAVKMKRREHKKSRAGCFNCKSRKIKVRPMSQMGTEDRR